MYNALDIAYWFIAQNDLRQHENNLNEDAYEGLTNMKVQKLLYFAQGIYFTFKNKKLFNDKIMAWDHGPVVKKVYEQFKTYGKEYIILNNDSKFDSKILEKIELDSETREILIDVFDCLNKYTAWQLRNISHDKNGPWYRIFNKNKYREIPLDDFFVSYFQNMFIRE